MRYRGIDIAALAVADAGEASEAEARAICFLLATAREGAELVIGERRLRAGAEAIREADPHPSEPLGWSALLEGPLAEVYASRSMVHLSYFVTAGGGAWERQMGALRREARAFAERWALFRPWLDALPGSGAGLLHVAVRALAAPRNIEEAGALQEVAARAGELPERDADVRAWIAELDEALEAVEPGIVAASMAAAGRALPASVEPDVLLDAGVPDPSPALDADRLAAAYPDLRGGCPTPSGPLAPEEPELAEAIAAWLELGRRYRG